MTSPAAVTSDCDPADERLAQLRRDIDALDAELTRLLACRREASRAIQQRRVATGGPRIQHARERAVLARYRDALGAEGTRIGLAVLELCRGRA